MKSQLQTLQEHHMRKVCLTETETSEADLQQVEEMIEDRVLNTLN